MQPLLGAKSMRALIPRKILILLLFGFLSSTRAQSVTDSLIASVSSFHDTVKVQKLNLLAVQYFARDISTAKQVAEKSVELATLIHYSKGQAEALRVLCSIYARQGQSSAALENCKKAEEIFAKLNSQTGLADVYSSTGMIFFQQAQYPSALENFTNSVRIWQQFNREDKIVLVTENIGLVYFRQQDYPLALKNFQECYALYKKLGSEAGASKILVNIGATYNRLKMPEKALQSHLESLTFFEKTNSVMGMGIAYNNIGNVYFETKNYKKALEYFEKSLALKKKMNDKAGTAVSLRNVAETYLFLNDLTKAKLNIDQSLKIAEEIGAKEQIKDAYDLLAKMYEKAKDYEKALEFEKKLAEEKDSIFSSEKTEQIARMRAIYETEKAKNETKLLSKDNEILSKDNELKNAQRNFLMAVAGALFLVVSMVAYLFVQKQKSNRVLTQKNVVIEKSLQEREGLLKEIHHRVKNNLQIISSLLSLQSKSLNDVDAQGAISESRNRVKSMSLIHEQLYQEDAISGVKMPEYLERLVNSLTASYGLDTERVQVRIEADDLLLDVDTAIPLGLIVNELVSNSMKYAFPNSEPGKILITLRDLMNELKLIVEDTGVGLDVTKENTHSFGLNMVKSLMRKLKAEMNIAAGVALPQKRGTSVELTIRDFKKVTFA